MILVIDNYDSFTWNLVQLVEMITDEDVRVIRNDAIDPGELDELDPSAIVISPGPGTPQRAGRSVDIVKAAGDTPLLGVCLGHQAIAVALGGRVRRSDVPRHGKVSRLTHEGTGLFRGCDAGLRIVRYHSLEIDREALPGELRVTAEADDGAVMAIEHASRPLFGVQFHPESYGTEMGRVMMTNFLEKRS